MPLNTSISLPKITLITPSLNQGAYLESTIQSVLAQDYPDLEYIIIDGGSSDQTLDILYKYRNQLFFISEQDRSQVHAINKGLQRASGAIIGFLNSDDLLAPGALIKIGNYFLKHPNIYWLTGRCCIIDKQGREVRRLISLYKEIWLLTRSRTALLLLNYISQPATFWRRYAFEAIGYFDEKWHYTMEYDYWLRLSQGYQLWLINDILANFRIHSTSKSMLGSQAQFAEDLLVARCYTESRLIIKLHDLHNRLIMAVYRLLQQ
jgi:glycosyltransferase involved in cell wall biosynthesis